MNLHTKETEEKKRAFKKLMKKWLNAAQTEEKANLILAKNPGAKRRKSQANPPSR